MLAHELYLTVNAEDTKATKLHTIQTNMIAIIDDQEQYVKVDTFERSALVQFLHDLHNNDLNTIAIMVMDLLTYPYLRYTNGFHIIKAGIYAKRIILKLTAIIAAASKHDNLVENKEGFIKTAQTAVGKIRDIQAKIKSFMLGQIEKPFLQTMNKAIKELKIDLLQIQFIHT